MVNCLIFLKEVVGFVLWWSNIDNFLWEFAKIERQKLSQSSERCSESLFGLASSRELLYDASNPIITFNARFWMLSNEKLRYSRKLKWKS